MSTPVIRSSPDDRLQYERGPETFYLDGKLINQTFAGVVDLSNDLTAYKNYTVSANITPTVGLGPIIGGSAEIRFIGDGSHSVTFTNFTASASSSSFSTTLAAVNKVVFYYDGTAAFYSLTVL